MNPYKEYEIEFVKLSNGNHAYNYTVGKDFFELFESELVTEGKVDIQVSFEKNENFFELNILHKGTIDLACDRCLDPIHYPVEGEQKLVVKAEEPEEDQDENVLYISPEAHSINLAQTYYELISLSIPMVRFCEEADKECNDQMIDKIYGNNKEDSSKGTDPRWNKLKDLYKK